MTTIKNYQWEDVAIYSATVAQEKYDYEKTAKGPELILDQDKKLVKHIE